MTDVQVIITENSYFCDNFNEKSVIKFTIMILLGIMLIEQYMQQALVVNVINVTNYYNISDSLIRSYFISLDSSFSCFN